MRTSVAIALVMTTLALCAPAKGQAFADGAGGVDRPSLENQLPIVIVTARRRAEDAQQVPGALSVTSGELLDRSYTSNTQGLTALVPSLNYSSANPRNTAFTIRGLGSSVVAVSQANDGLEPGVGFYVDQVYHARPATAAFDFADIDQVEILRGPQGTLFWEEHHGRRHQHHEPRAQFRQRGIRGSKLRGSQLAAGTVVDDGPGFRRHCLQDLCDFDSARWCDRDPSLSRFTYIQGYNLTNASVGYRFRSGLELILFARNLFNADYFQNVTVQAGNSGLILGAPSDPRVIGGTIRLRR